MPRISWETQSLYEDLRTTKCHYCNVESMTLVVDYTPPITVAYRRLFESMNYAPKCAVNICKPCRSLIARARRTKCEELGHSDFFLTMEEKKEAVEGRKHRRLSTKSDAPKNNNGIVHSIWGFMAPSELIQVSPGTFYLNDELWTLDDVHRCQGLWALMFAKAPIEAIKSYVSVQGGFEPKHLSILNHEGINK